MAGGRPGRPKGSGPTPGSFKKGQSGNPGGRPKGLAAFRRELADASADKVAAQRLLQILKDGDDTVAMRAIEHTHAYLYGKATQAVEVTGKNGAPIESETKATVKHEQPATPEQLSEVVRLLVVSGAVALPGEPGALPSGTHAAANEVLDSQPDAAPDGVPAAPVP